MKLQWSYGFSKVKTQKNKVTIDDETTEFAIPVLSLITRRDAERMLLMVKSFQAASAFANWSPEFFFKVRNAPSRHCVTAWQAIITTSPLRTANQFNIFLRNFIKKTWRQTTCILLETIFVTLRNQDPWALVSSLSASRKFIYLLRTSPGTRNGSIPWRRAETDFIQINANGMAAWIYLSRKASFRCGVNRFRAIHVGSRSH